MISYTTYRKYCISNFLINIIKCKKCTYLLDQYDCKLLYTVQCCTFACRYTLQFLKKYISTQHFSSRWLFGLNILQHDFLLPPLQLSAVATKVSHIMIVIFFFAIEKRVERGGGKARRRVKRPPSHLSKSAQYKKAFCYASSSSSFIHCLDTERFIQQNLLLTNPSK